MSLVSAIEAPLSISNAIRKASQATGTDFSYLLKTAARESAFKTSAKAKTSSATGLFQFIESTWLKTVKEAGDKFGLDKYTPHIFKTQSGRLYVPNQKLRAEILQLRNDPEISAVMAGAFTQKNSEFIASELGREPTQGELYIAHFLGPKGASELISLAENNPNARADRNFPRAARANKSIFYSRGRPRTVLQVYNELVGGYAKSQAVAANPIGTAARPAAAGAAALTNSSERGWDRLTGDECGHWRKQIRMRRYVSYFLFEPCNVAVTMSRMSIGLNRSERMSMRSQQFRQWRKSHGLKQKEAAELLGLKKRMIQYYEKGERDGEKVPIPRR